jgi:hypothetical protein
MHVQQKIENAFQELDGILDVRKADGRAISRRCPRE